jgi:hypothetical protein
LATGAPWHMASKVPAGGSRGGSTDFWTRRGHRDEQVDTECKSRRAVTGCKSRRVRRAYGRCAVSGCKSRRAAGAYGRSAVSGCKIRRHNAGAYGGGDCTQGVSGWWQLHNVGTYGVRRRCRGTNGCRQVNQDGDGCSGIYTPCTIGLGKRYVFNNKVLRGPNICVLLQNISSRNSLGGRIRVKAIWNNGL